MLSTPGMASEAANRLDALLLYILPTVPAIMRFNRAYNTHYTHIIKVFTAQKQERLLKQKRFFCFNVKI